MEEKIKSIFEDVSEHDMDMLFLEEFASSDEFLTLFTSRINISDYEVVSVQSSKREIDLGESDMTVIIQKDNKRIGLLIEDKIDAIAMPDQYERYNLRGQRGIENNEYDEFYVFLVAPEKYLSSNSEAAKYPNKVKYEEILDYFSKLDDRRSQFKHDQIKFAIEKQKKQYEPIEDPRVTQFWKEYYQYQQKNHRSLLLLYDNKKKGTKSGWPRFNTYIEKLYIIHKSNFGCIDLTFDGCGNKMLEIEDMIASILPNYYDEGYTIQRIGKAASIRLNVPIVDFHKPFDEQIDAVKKCFDIIEKMNSFVKELNVYSVNTLLSSGSK